MSDNPTYCLLVKNLFNSFYINQMMILVPDTISFQDGRFPAIFRRRFNFIDNDLIFQKFVNYPHNPPIL